MCFAQKHNKAQVEFAPKTLYHLATFTDVEKLLVKDLGRKSMFPA